MKYATLADLKAAYDSGELSRANSLVLDNDYVAVYDTGGGAVYEGDGPAALIEEALDLLGIPHENA
jgi:hypothetical protein